MRIVWRHSLNVEKRNKTAVGFSKNVNLAVIHPFIKIIYPLYQLQEISNICTI